MRNSCQITFEGLNVNRVLSQLGKLDVALYSVERQGKITTIQVPARRAKQTVALLQEKCYNIIGIKYFGLTAAAKFVKFRFILPIICFVSVIVLAISSQFCFKIVVSGDFDSNAVYEALNSAGVKVGSNMSKLNVDVLENTLATEMGAMYAVVTRSGSVLYVNVVAKKQIDPPIDMTKRRDIVATRAGVVTQILCEQGNALVKVGDTVQVGDVLIEGKRIFNDGTYNEVYALGMVTLRINATGYAEYTGYKSVTVETGKVFKNTGVVLFGKEYAKSCPFADYTVTTSVTRLAPLNLEIRKNEYHEIQTVEVEAPFAECIEQLRAKAYQAAKEMCDFVIVDTQYTESVNGVTATLYGELRIE